VDWVFIIACSLVFDYLYSHCHSVGPFLKVNNKFFFQKILFVLENIENQIIEIVEVFAKDTIESCYLISDCLHLPFKGNFSL
jgi:hypothetical protein